MKKYTFIILLIIVLICTTLLIVSEIHPGDENPIEREGPAKLSISTISVSASTAPATPGTFLVDDDFTTGWGPGDGETAARAELDLTENTLVYGIELAGSFTAADTITIQYLLPSILTS